jgi:hypothetical protein
MSATAGRHPLGRDLILVVSALWYRYCVAVDNLFRSLSSTVTSLHALLVDAQREWRLQRTFDSCM